MQTKKFLTVGAVALGLGVGAIVGFQQIKNTDFVSAQSGFPTSVSPQEIKQINAGTQPPPTAIEFDSSVYYTPQDWQAKKSELADKPGIEVFKPVEGIEYILIVPAGLEGRVAALKEKLTEDANKRQNSEKASGRTDKDRAVIVSKIKAMFGERNVQYLRVTKSTEYYQDDKGMNYFVDLATNRVRRVQMADNFAQVRKDIYDGEKGWKEKNVSQVQARENVIKVIRGMGLDEKRENEIINGLKMENIKGNFAFYYGINIDGEHQLEIGIEPVTGSVMKFVDRLNEVAQGDNKMLLGTCWGTSDDGLITRYCESPTNTTGGSWSLASCQAGNRQATGSDYYTLNAYGTGWYYTERADWIFTNDVLLNAYVTPFAYVPWYFPYTGGVQQNCTGTCGSSCYANKNPTTQAKYRHYFQTVSGGSCYLYGYSVVATANQYTEYSWHEGSEDQYWSYDSDDTGEQCIDFLTMGDYNSENSYTRRIYWDGVKWEWNE